jgi:hypothetical protein
MTKSKQQQQAPEYRTPIERANGRAAWWPKDGAWHIAIRTAADCLWTAQQYPTRAAAEAALKRDAERRVAEYLDRNPY